MRSTLDPRPSLPGTLARRGLLLAAALCGLSAQAEEARPVDVLVVGGTPAGICAAVAAARGGARVTLLEETRHVGGIVSSGLTNTDLHDTRAVKGLFEEFRRRIFDHYVQSYGPTSQQVHDCRNGFSYEPKVAEAVFNQMLAGEQNIRVVLNLRLRAVHCAGTRLARVVMEEPAANAHVVEFAARAFIDATYEGDLAALAGVPYRVGRESRGAYGERQAGRIYARFAQDEWLEGSTGEGDRGLQAFCFRFHVTRDPAGRVPLEKPAAYNRDDYRFLRVEIQAGKVQALRDVMQLWLTPNGKFQTNSENPRPRSGAPSESFDLAEENWDWPEAGPARRAEIFRRNWDYSAGLFWFLQHDPAVPETLRTEALQYGLPRDEFTDNGHRPWQIYVRQGRRIWGEYTFTQRDADPDRPRRRADSIAMIEFPFDSHGVHKYDPAHPGLREGYFFIAHPPLPLPYGAIVPQQVDGLLVPVAVSASHVGYQAIRVEPTFMVLGEAAGVAAQLAVAEGVDVRRVPLDKLRAELLRRGAVLELEPLPEKPPRAARR